MKFMPDRIILGEINDYNQNVIHFIDEYINNHKIETGIVENSKNNIYISSIINNKLIKIIPIDYTSKTSSFIIEVFDQIENFFLYAFHLSSKYNLAKLFNSKTKFDTREIKKKIICLFKDHFPVFDDDIVDENFQSRFVSPLENNIYVDDNIIIAYYVPGQYLYFDENNILKQSLKKEHSKPTESRFNNNIIKETNSVAVKAIYTKKEQKIYVCEDARVSFLNKIIRKKCFDFHYFKELDFNSETLFFTLKEKTHQEIFEALNEIFWFFINYKIENPFLSLNQQKPKETQRKWLKGTEEDFHKIIKAYIIANIDQAISPEINYRIYSIYKKHNKNSKRFFIDGFTFSTKDQKSFFKKINKNFIFKENKLVVTPPSEFQILPDHISSESVEGCIEKDKISAHNIIDAKIHLNKWLKNH